MPTATWEGAIVANSTDTEQVEGNHYFPASSLCKELLEPSSHTTICPWKGTAHYYNIVVEGRRNENAAWYYPEPKSAASNIKDHVAFWKGVKVEA